MTNAEAVTLLMNISAYDIDNKRGTQKQEALNMAIKALEQQPSEDCISREALLNSLKGFEILHNHDELRSNLIYGIMNLPSVTPTIFKMEQVEDCVARSEALDILDDFEVDIENGKFKTAYAKARERMCEFPPVTPQPKTGHWIDIMVGDMQAQACDQCKTFYPLAYTGGGHRFCPNCGAKMEVEE